MNHQTSWHTFLCMQLYRSYIYFGNLNQWFVFIKTDRFLAFQLFQGANTPNYLILYTVKIVFKKREIKVVVVIHIYLHGLRGPRIGKRL